MQCKNLILILLLITFSCKKDGVCPEPETPPKESSPTAAILAPEIPHFEDNRRTPFPDIPPAADPTVSAEYRLKKKIIFYNPASGNPSAYLLLDYDTDGNLTKESFIDFPNTLSHYYTYEYQDGKLKKNSFFGRNIDKVELGQYITYEYQNNKLVKSETKTIQGNTLSFVQYEYARNRLIKLTFGGPSTQVFKYFYDSEGKVKQEKSFSATNQPSSIIKFKYDNEDRVIRKEYFEVRDKLAYLIDSKYTHNEKEPAETIRLTQDGIFENKRKYWYNGNRFITEIAHEDANGTNPLERNLYQDGLIREKRTYADHWGFAESTMNRYEYERK